MLASNLEQIRSGRLPRKEQSLAAWAMPFYLYREIDTGQLRHQNIEISMSGALNSAATRALKDSRKPLPRNRFARGLSPMSGQ